MWNAGKVPARMIEIISPAGFEHFFWGLADHFEAGPPDPEVIGKMAAEYGLQFGEPPVRDVQLEHERLLAAGIPVIRKPQQEPWGLVEMWIADPDGVRIVEVPKDHPLRRDQR